MTLLLGYAVGSGDQIRIPLRHMAIAGQTQEAGKTTTLEAVIGRSHLRALTFITKRGESAFREAHRLRPYFREQADWQFVASILEASRGERMKFERAWIIRASRGARTLADVHRNVKRLLDSAKRGMDADVYLTLDAYLEVVVPAIGAVQWATRVDLQPGVNVMDLTSLQPEMQHLVIKSAVDWVLQHESDTVVVIPEAWKFVPEGRGTPVKRSVDALIRQGAAMRNFVWVDSQDLGGVSKELLRHVPVWLLGVQRESNEIKRTLANIPANVAKPKPGDIATLDLGHFYVCWGRHVIQTYVQPAWLDAATAQLVARGEHNPDDDAVRRPEAKEEDVQAKLVEEQLRAENERLRQEVQELRVRLLQHGMNPDARPIYGDPLLRRGVALPPAEPPEQRAAPAPAPLPTDAEALYQTFKTRLMDEASENPTMLSILLNRPELQVKIRRHVIEVDGDTLRGRIARLLLDGFLDEPRGPSAVIAELQRRGAGSDVKFNVGKELQTLASMGFLLREGKTSDTKYQAVPTMKRHVVEI